MIKEAMLAAVKRKRADLQQHEEDSKGPHAEGQSAKDGDDELAPARGEGEAGTMKSREEKYGDTRDADVQGETREGLSGFDKIDKSTAPANSKNLFHDPKVDTHDDADPNMQRNMAGDGSNSKYDKMGVDEHEDPRLQSSKMAATNMAKNKALKLAAHNKIDRDVNVDGDGMDDHGEGSFEGKINQQQQKGFPARKSKVNMSGDKEQMPDQDMEGVAGKGGLYAEHGEGDEQREAFRQKGPMKMARAKLDGFLGKMKKS